MNPSRSCRNFSKPGDIVYVKIVSLTPDGKALRSLSNKIPATQGALIAIDNATGEIKAMVGGRTTSRNRNLIVPRKPCARWGARSSPMSIRLRSIKVRSPMTRFSTLL